MAMSWIRVYDFTECIFELKCDIRVMTLLAMALNDLCVTQKFPDFSVLLYSLYFAFCNTVHDPFSISMFLLYILSLHRVFLRDLNQNISKST